MKNRTEKIATKGCRAMAAVLALLLLLSGIFPSVPVLTAQAASDRIFVKGDTKTTFTKTVPKNIQVGGVNVNLDYMVGGKMSGVPGKWSSSNTKIVKVSSRGICKAVGNGAVTISYTYTLKGKKQVLKTYLLARTRAKECDLVAKDPEDFDGHLEINDYVVFNGLLTPIDKAVAINSKIKSTYLLYPALYNDKACTKLHDGSVASLGTGKTDITVTGEGDGVVYLKTQAKNGDEATSYIIDSQIIKITVGEGGGEEEEEGGGDTEYVTGAKQTDVNKITVTSVDPITSVAIKLGNTVLVQKTGSPVISEDKHTAVVSLPGEYAETTYTILINNAVAGINVKCEKRRVDKIVLDSKNAILDILAPIGTTRYPVATVKYKVFDQFGIDLTNNPSYPTTDFISGGIFKISSPGVLSYQFNTTPTLETSYPIVLTYTKGTTSVTVNETVVLSKPSYVNTISFQGLYRYTGTDKGYERVATATSCALSADADQIVSYGGTPQSTKTVGAYYLLFKANNQYGGTVAEAGIDATQLVVTLSGGLTNLTLDTVSVPGTTGQRQQSINAVTIDNVDYLAYPLRAGKIGSGDARIFVYSVYNANARLDVTMSVSAAHAIKTLTVSQSENIYETKPTYLNFTAVDTYGNTITDYDTLVKYSGAPSGDKTAQIPSNIIKSTSQNSKFYWEKQTDGTAKLKYVPASGIVPAGAGASVYGVDSIMTMMASVNLQTFQVNVFGKPVPKKIYAMKPTAATGALTGGGENMVVIRQRDIQIIDQYGLEMPDELVKDSGYWFAVDNFVGSTTSFTSFSAINVKIDSSADNETNQTGAYKPIIQLPTSANAGSATFNLYLATGQDSSSKIADSYYTVPIKSVNINDLLLNGFEVEPLGSLGNGSTAGTDSQYFRSFRVTGKSTDGIRVTIPANQFSVYGVSEYADQFLNKTDKYINPRAVLLSTLYPGAGIISKEMKYIVVINNSYGTEISTSCTISNQQPMPKSFKINTAEGAAVAGNTLEGADLRNLVMAYDQYGSLLNNSGPGITIRFTVSNLPGGATVDRNGTDQVKVNNLTVGSSITVRFAVNDLDPITVTLQVKAK